MSVGARALQSFAQGKDKQYRALRTVRGRRRGWPNDKGPVAMRLGHAIEVGSANYRTHEACCSHGRTCTPRRMLPWCGAKRAWRASTRLRLARRGRHFDRLQLMRRLWTRPRRRARPGDWIGLGVGVGRTVALGCGCRSHYRCRTSRSGVGVGVPPAGAWIATVIGDPVLKKSTVAFAVCGG